MKGLQHLYRHLAQLTNSFDEALALCSDEWFAQARALVIKLCEALEKIKPLFLYKKNGENTLERKNSKGLDMLLLIYKDLLYVQLGEEDRLVFMSRKRCLNRFPMLRSALYQLSLIY